MPNFLANKASGPTVLDNFAAKACTQSGTLALLLSVAVLLLIPYWVQRPQEISLNRYIAYRYGLAFEVEALDADPIFQKYKASEQSADSMPIAKLSDVSVVISDTSNNKPVQTKSQPAPPPKKHTSPVLKDAQQPPNAPQLLRAIVTASLVEMPSISDLLIELNDPRLLGDSMKVSNFFDISVSRWFQKRDEQMYHNQALQFCTTARLDVPTLPAGVPAPNYFVPLMDKDALLQCLTLRDVRELAAFELPTFGNPLQYDERIAKPVDVKPGSVPGDLYAAGIVLQVSLFFVLVYFAAFARVAVSSPEFPAKGTLFGAFSGSRWTLFVLLLALWTPAIASITMSLISREWLLIICSAPILYTVLSVHVCFHDRSYFNFRSRK
jgi:hypothetical protein